MGKIHCPLFAFAHGIEIPDIKTIRSISIRHRFDTFVSDRCLINIDPRVLAIWDTASGYGLSYPRQQSKRGVYINLNRRETYTHEFRYEDRDEIGNPLVSLLLSGSFSHDDNAICYKCISQRPMGNSMITIELYTRKQRCHDIMYSGNNYPTSLLQFAFHNDYEYRFCLHNEPSVRLLTNLPLDKMTVISQTTISNAFLWMKSFASWLQFHWSLLLRVQLTITQHWLI